MASLPIAMGAYDACERPYDPRAVRRYWKSGLSVGGCVVNQRERETSYPPCVAIRPSVLPSSTRTASAWQGNVVGGAPRFRQAENSGSADRVLPSGNYHCQCCSLTATHQAAGVGRQMVYQGTAPVEPPPDCSGLPVQRYAQRFSPGLWPPPVEARRAGHTIGDPSIASKPCLREHEVHPPVHVDTKDSVPLIIQFHLRRFVPTSLSKLADCGPLSTKVTYGRHCALKTRPVSPMPDQNPEAENIIPTYRWNTLFKFKLTDVSAKIKIAISDVTKQRPTNKVALCHLKVSPLLATGKRAFNGNLPMLSPDEKIVGTLETQVEFIEIRNAGIYPLRHQEGQASSSKPAREKTVAVKARSAPKPDDAKDTGNTTPLQEVNVEVVTQSSPALAPGAVKDSMTGDLELGVEDERANRLSNEFFTPLLDAAQPGELISSEGPSNLQEKAPLKASLAEKDQTADDASVKDDMSSLPIPQEPGLTPLVSGDSNTMAAVAEGSTTIKGPSIYKPKPELISLAIDTIENRNLEATQAAILQDAKNKRNNPPSKQYIGPAPPTLVDIQNQEAPQPILRLAAEDTFRNYQREVEAAMQAKNILKGAVADEDASKIYKYDSELIRLATDTIETRQLEALQDAKETEDKENTKHSKQFIGPAPPTLVDIQNQEVAAENTFRNYQIEVKTAMAKEVLSKTARDVEPYENTAASMHLCDDSDEIPHLLERIADTAVPLENDELALERETIDDNFTKMNRTESTEELVARVADLLEETSTGTTTSKLADFASNLSTIIRGKDLRQSPVQSAVENDRHREADETVYIGMAEAKKKVECVEEVSLEVLDQLSNVLRSKATRLASVQQAVCVAKNKALQSHMLEGELISGTNVAQKATSRVAHLNDFTAHLASILLSRSGASKNARLAAELAARRAENKGDNSSQKVVENLNTHSTLLCRLEAMFASKEMAYSISKIATHVDPSSEGRGATVEDEKEGTCDKFRNRTTSPELDVLSATASSVRLKSMRAAHIAEMASGVQNKTLWKSKKNHRSSEIELQDGAADKDEYTTENRSSSLRIGSMSTMVKLLARSKSHPLPPGSAKTYPGVTTDSTFVEHLKTILKSRHQGQSAAVLASKAAKIKQSEEVVYENTSKQSLVVEVDTHGKETVTEEVSNRLSDILRRKSSRMCCIFEAVQIAKTKMDLLPVTRIDERNEQDNNVVIGSTTEAVAEQAPAEEHKDDDEFDESGTEEWREGDVPQISAAVHEHSRIDEITSRLETLLHLRSVGSSIPRITAKIAESEKAARLSSQRKQDASTPEKLAADENLSNALPPVSPTSAEETSGFKDTSTTRLETESQAPGETRSYPETGSNDPGEANNDNKATTGIMLTLARDISTDYVREITKSVLEKLIPECNETEQSEEKANNDWSAWENKMAQGIAFVEDDNESDFSSSNEEIVDLKNPDFADETNPYVLAIRAAKNNKPTDLSSEPNHSEENDDGAISDCTALPELRQDHAEVPVVDSTNEFTIENAMAQFRSQRTETLMGRTVKEALETQRKRELLGRPQPLPVDDDSSERLLCAGDFNIQEIMREEEEVHQRAEAAVAFEAPTDDEAQSQGEPSSQEDDMDVVKAMFRSQKTLTMVGKNEDEALEYERVQQKLRQALAAVSEDPASMESTQGHNNELANLVHNIELLSSREQDEIFEKAEKDMVARCFHFSQDGHKPPTNNSISTGHEGRESLSFAGGTTSALQTRTQSRTQQSDTAQSREVLSLSHEKHQTKIECHAVSKSSTSCQRNPTRASMVLEASGPNSELLGQDEDMWSGSSDSNDDASSEVSETPAMPIESLPVEEETIPETNYATQLLPKNREISIEGNPSSVHDHSAESPRGMTPGRSASTYLKSMIGPRDPFESIEQDEKMIAVVGVNRERVLLGKSPTWQQDEEYKAELENPENVECVTQGSDGGPRTAQIGDQNDTVNPGPEVGIIMSVPIGERNPVVGDTPQDALEAGVLATASVEISKCLLEDAYSNSNNDKTLLPVIGDVSEQGKKVTQAISAGMEDDIRSSGTEQHHRIRIFETGTETPSTRARTQDRLESLSASMDTLDVESTTAEAEALRNSFSPGRRMAAEDESDIGMMLALGATSHNEHPYRDMKPSAVEIHEMELEGNYVDSVMRLSTGSEIASLKTDYKDHPLNRGDSSESRNMHYTAGVSEEDVTPRWRLTGGKTDGQSDTYSNAGTIQTMTLKSGSGSTLGAPAFDTGNQDQDLVSTSVMEHCNEETPLSLANEVVVDDLPMELPSQDAPTIAKTSQDASNRMTSLQDTRETQLMLPTLTDLMMPTISTGDSTEEEDYAEHQGNNSATTEVSMDARAEEAPTNWLKQMQDKGREALKQTPQKVKMLQMGSPSARLAGLGIFGRKSKEDQSSTSKKKGLFSL